MIKTDLESPDIPQSASARGCPGELIEKIEISPFHPHITSPQYRKEDTKRHDENENLPSPPRANALTAAPPPIRIAARGLSLRRPSGAGAAFFGAGAGAACAVRQDALPWNRSFPAAPSRWKSPTRRLGAIARAGPGHSGANCRWTQGRLV